jgi:hypothetical protein
MRVAAAVPAIMIRQHLVCLRLSVDLGEAVLAVPERQDFREHQIPAAAVVVDPEYLIAAQAVQAS